MAEGLGDGDGNVGFEYGVEVGNEGCECLVGNGGGMFVAGEGFVFCGKSQGGKMVAEFWVCEGAEGDACLGRGVL